MRLCFFIEKIIDDKSNFIFDFVAHALGNKGQIRGIGKFKPQRIEAVRSVVFFRVKKAFFRNIQSDDHHLLFFPVGTFNFIAKGRKPRISIIGKDESKTRFETKALENLRV